MKGKKFFIMLLSIAFLLIPAITCAADYTGGPDSEKLKAILSDFETYAKKGMAVGEGSRNGNSHRQRH